MKLSTSTLFLLVAALADSTNAFSVVGSNAPVATRTSTMSLQAKPNQKEEPLIQKSFANVFGSMILTASLVFGTTFATAIPPAHADGSKVVGELKGSGLLFKDTLKIERFDDPKVKGVTLYISNFDRPVTEKLSGGFFNDPSYASVGCAKTGPIAIANNIAKGNQGEEVFEESRSLLFKTLRVQRIYDVEKNTVVYVSFNTRLDKGEDSNKSRFKSSLCAVSLDDPTPVATPAATDAAPSAK
jgi:CreA protein